MANLLTEITEIVTGLGMTGIGSLKEALGLRPDVMRYVAPENWDRLDAAYYNGIHLEAFSESWANGRAFLESPDGLRNREPMLIEWKGSHQPPGFDFLPADIRVDHVYLVSCKYQSKILANSSPSNLFLRRLADRTAAPETESWYSLCAPENYQHFYCCVRRHIGRELLPLEARDLTKADLSRIRTACGGTWPTPLSGLWEELSFAVAEISASKWSTQIPAPKQRREMLWRLLRLNPSPYFVLGSGDSGPLRIRVGTPWDWLRRFELSQLDIAAVAAGQPKVTWSARIKDKELGEERVAEGHVEIRWSHGRFSSVEAKIYLDTSHNDVPGYFPLAPAPS